MVTCVDTTKICKKKNRRCMARQNLRTSVVITGRGRLDNNKVVIQDSKREKKFVAEKNSES